MLIADIRHFGDLLDPTAEIPGRARALGRYLADIVSAASAGYPDPQVRTWVRCRRRPRRQPCPGHIQAGIVGPDRILWTCDRCGDEGSVTGWLDGAFDLHIEPSDVWHSVFVPRTVWQDLVRMHGLPKPARRPICRAQVWRTKVELMGTRAELEALRKAQPLLLREIPWPAETDDGIELPREVQPDLSAYELRMTARIPLDRREAEPDDVAFVRHELELLRRDPDGGDSVVGTAVVYRVRTGSGMTLEWAADAEPDSLLLEEVCLRGLTSDGGVSEGVCDVLVDVFPIGVLVLDLLAFPDPRDDTPLVVGLLARGALELIGQIGDVLFLPPDRSELWERALGALQAGPFVVCALDLAMPPFPLRRA